MKLKRLTTLAVFTVVALTIFVVESAIPVPVPIPGIKLGLANIVTLLVLLNYRPADAFFVLFTRILLSSMFAGHAISLLYSLGGGLCCFATMCGVNRFLGGKYIFITSIFGALAHNAGQLLVAYLILRSVGVFTYLPFLTISAIVTGLFTGLCAHYSRKYLMRHIPKF